MTSKNHHSIQAGFLPLVDAAILIAAKEKGFADAEQIDLTLVKETSWANIRDRMAIGHFDVAHMLAPMPLAAALGLMPLKLKILAPMALGVGGNAITISTKLADELSNIPRTDRADPLDALSAGEQLRHVIENREEVGANPLVFGVVHPYSGHNYELRYWLAASGIDPERDVEIVVVPPPLMADALQSGMLDGFCVGEPWNSVAVSRGVGKILTTKSRIWKTSPEKVLGISEKLNTNHPEKVLALIRALYEAAKWCADDQNLDELAQILSRSQYLGVEAAIIAKSLGGQIGDNEVGDEEFLNCFDRAATFPWLSHALWFYSQMVRWGHVKWSADHAAIISDCYRPDLYRRALADTSSILPSANSKVEGALAEATYVGTSKGQLLLGPDGFFDGEIFDPDHLQAYIKAQEQGN